MTKAEQLTILASKLMKYEEQLVESTTGETYKGAIQKIKTFLDIILHTEELNDFHLTVLEIKIRLERLEVGEIIKSQFSCDKLYKQLVIMAAEKVEN